jgi:hypothetical protein
MEDLVAARYGGEDAADARARTRELVTELEAAFPDEEEARP